MNLFKKITTGFLALSLALSVASASAATSDDGTATVAITSAGGLLEVEIDNATFVSKPYDFAAQSTTGTIVVRAQDNTGTGLGWNVTVYGDDFTDGATPTPHTFAVSNLGLSNNNVASTVGQPATTVTQSGTTSGMPSTSGTAAKILNANINNGSGRYTATYNGALNIPGGTLVGTYTSTLYVSISTGP